MNKNVESIINAYAFITNNFNKSDIINILSQSEVFNEIANNNPIYLYEGYPANLLAIVDELKELPHCPPEVYKITESSIVQYNRSQRIEKSTIGMRSITPVSANLTPVFSPMPFQEKPHGISLTCNPVTAVAQVHVYDRDESETPKTRRIRVQLYHGDESETPKTGRILVTDTSSTTPRSKRPKTKKITRKKKGTTV